MYDHLFGARFFVFEDDAPTFQEAVLQAIWNEGLVATDLRGAAGEHIAVVHPGVWNVSAGPDFHDAVLVIDGKTHRGPVEIHLQPDDWTRHGHDGNPDYEATILHVVWHNPRQHRRHPPHMPLCVLAGQLSTPLPDILERFDPTAYPYARKVAPSDAATWFNGLDNDRVRELLRACGIARVLDKARVLSECVARVGLEEAVYRGLLDVLGYGSNRAAFAQLAERLPLADLAGEGGLADRVGHSEENGREGKIGPPHLLADARLLGAAGLLPDPTRQPVLDALRPWLGRLWDAWWPHQTGAEPIPWRRHRQRPANAPERRLLAASRLLSRHRGQLGAALLAQLNADCTPRAAIAELRQHLTVDDPGHADFLNFERRLRPPGQLLGGARVLDLVVNLAIPLYLADALQRGDLARCERGKALLLACPRLQDNRRLQEAAHHFFVPPSRIRDVVADACGQQGMLKLHGDYLAHRGGANRPDREPK